MKRAYDTRSHYLRQNPLSLPPSHLVIRAILLTALIHIFFIIPLLTFLQHRKHPHIAIVNHLDFFLSVGFGILVGAALIWWVFPPLYHPHPGGSDITFPKLFWIGWCNFLFAPPLYFFIGGVSLFDFNSPEKFSMFKSPLMFNLLIGHFFSLLTYFLYFFILERLMQKPKRKRNFSTK